MFIFLFIYFQRFNNLIKLTRPFDVSSFSSLKFLFNDIKIKFYDLKKLFLWIEKLEKTSLRKCILEFFIVYLR